jgi:hypothetical protein
MRAGDASSAVDSLSEAAAIFASLGENLDEAEARGPLWFNGPDGAAAIAEALEKRGGETAAAFASYQAVSVGGGEELMR